MADVNRDLYGAAGRGDLAAVRKLLRRGADVNWQNPDLYGYTPLMAASKFGHETVVVQLLRAGANRNIVEELNRRTARRFAELYKHHNIVLRLEEPTQYFRIFVGLIALVLCCASTNAECRATLTADYASGFIALCALLRAADDVSVGNYRSGVPILLAVMLWYYQPIKACWDLHTLSSGWGIVSALRAGWKGFGVVWHGLVAIVYDTRAKSADRCLMWGSDGLMQTGGYVSAGCWDTEADSDWWVIRRLRDCQTAVSNTGYFMFDSGTKANQRARSHLAEAVSDYGIQVLAVAVGLMIVFRVGPRHRLTRGCSWSTMPSIRAWSRSVSSGLTNRAASIAKRTRIVLVTGAFALPNALWRCLAYVVSCMQELATTVRALVISANTRMRHRREVEVLQRQNRELQLEHADRYRELLQGRTVHDDEITSLKQLVDTLKREVAAAQRGEASSSTEQAQLQGAEQLLDDLTCPVCLEVYEDPVTLPCGHNICEKDVEPLSRASRTDRFFRCPKCRQPCAFRRRAKVNFELKELIASLRLLATNGQPPQEDT